MCETGLRCIWIGALIAMAPLLLFMLRGGGERNIGLFVWILLGWGVGGMLMLTGLLQVAIAWVSREPESGRCECGYLLRGLPQRRCPECGRVF